MASSKVGSYFQNVFVIVTLSQEKIKIKDQINQKHSFTLKRRVSSLSSNNRDLFLGGFVPDLIWSMRKFFAVLTNVNLWKLPQIIQISRTSVHFQKLGAIDHTVKVIHSKEL